MPDTIQRWVNNTVEDSQGQWAFLETQQLDDTFGWGAMTGILHARMGRRDSAPKEKSSRSCGLLLTGPEGCGKHTAAAHMMKHLHIDGYEMVFLNGMTLSDNAAQTIQLMEALLEYFLEREQAVCILLEEMEECPCRREVLTYFGQQLRNYWISDFPPLFLILIDGQEQQVPSCLRSQLMLCRMSLPDKNQRGALLKKFAANLDTVLSLECFAEASNGASYAQLLDMISAVYWLVDSQDLMTLSDEALRRFLAAQMPAPAPEDAMHKLVETAQKVAEQLPQILKEVGAATRASVAMPAAAPVATPVQPVLNPQNQNPANFVASRRKEIEEMAPSQLAKDLFSEEDIQEMVASAEMRV